MSQSAKPVAPQRYRETFGRYYEDFIVGDVYEHRPGRTISETDNTWFTLLTMNTHPLHFDAEYGKASEFGKCIVASPLTLAILVGMSVTDVSQKAIANMGWKDIRMTAPVFAGDTLFAGSVGRTDLPGGSTTQLIDGIRKHLLTLPPQTTVFSGHGPQTTIGDEFADNPFLS